MRAERRAEAPRGEVQRWRGLRFGEARVQKRSCCRALPQAARGRGLANSVKPQALLARKHPETEDEQASGESMRACRGISS